MKRETFHVLLALWVAFWFGLATGKHVYAAEPYFDWAGPKQPIVSFWRPPLNLEDAWVVGDPRTAEWGEVRPPPPRYDFEPIVPVKIYRLGYSDLIRECASGDAVAACSYFEGDTCVIILPAVIDPELQSTEAHILRHEKAHCNGWTHPGDNGDPTKAGDPSYTN